jgi:hypothetical protein
MASSSEETMPSRNGLLKLGVVLVFALSGALWCGAVFFDGRSERNAIAVIEAAGAHVAYLTHINGARTDIDVEPPRSRSWRGTARINWRTVVASQRLDAIENSCLGCK